MCRAWHELISGSRPLMATLASFRKQQQQSKKSEPATTQSSGSDENSHKARLQSTVQLKEISEKDGISFRISLCF